MMCMSFDNFHTHNIMYELRYDSQQPHNYRDATYRRSWEADGVAVLCRSKSLSDPEPNEKAYAKMLLLTFGPTSGARLSFSYADQFGLSRMIWIPGYRTVISCVIEEMKYVPSI